MRFITLFFLTFLTFQSFANKRLQYPIDWWRPVDRTNAPHWEILPQDALNGEVILSKRTELGVFSNLAHAEFIFDGIFYASLEGLWQGMKYPDPFYPDDTRNLIQGWKYSRRQVYLLHGKESKKAGKEANSLMKTHSINWISYKGRYFNYRDLQVGSAFHLEIIRKATLQKVLQNPEIKSLLLKTRGLRLRADHKERRSSPASYKYYKILMDIRDHIL